MCSRSFSLLTQPKTQIKFIFKEVAEDLGGDGGVGGDPGHMSVFVLFGYHEASKMLIGVLVYSHFYSAARPQKP